MHKIIFILSFFGVFSCQSIRQEEPPQENPPAIGTSYFAWVDSNRVDPYYGGHRLVNVQLWYPAAAMEKTQGFKRAPYYYAQDLLSDQEGYWSEEDLNFLKGIKTKGYLDLPILESDNPYPILIFSPSLGGNLSLYTYYAEQLAEQGFVVAGVNHLYESEYVISPEKEIFFNNEEFHDSLKTLEIPAQITAEEYRSVKSFRAEVLGQDLLFCLDRLKGIHQLNEHLDFTRIGAWGHSIGGAAATYAAYQDSRIKAVVNLDGTPPSVTVEEGIDGPYLFIEDLTDYRNHPGYQKLHNRRNSFCEKVRKGAFRILIGEINHNSFLDMGLHTASSASAKSESLKLLSQVNNYLDSFFKHHLMEEPLEWNAISTDSLEIIPFPSD